MRVWFEGGGWKILAVEHTGEIQNFMGEFR